MKRLIAILSLALVATWSLAGLAQTAPSAPAAKPDCCAKMMKSHQCSAKCCCKGKNAAMQCCSGMAKTGAQAQSVPDAQKPEMCQRMSKSGDCCAKSCCKGKDAMHCCPTADHDHAAS